MGSVIQLKNSIIDDDIVQEIPQELLSKANDLGKKLDKSVNKSSFLNSFIKPCLLYTSPSPRDKTVSRMPSSA